MVLFLECLVCCVLFGVVVTHSTAKNTLSWLKDYPPAIQARVRSLPQYQSISFEEKRFWGRKVVSTVLVVCVFSLLIYRLNGARTFWQGFFDSYIIWLAITWFDALIIDCLWFCHSRKVRIPGTEDMVGEYHNYLFHIRQSVKGSLIGVPACVLVGATVALVSAL